MQLNIFIKVTHLKLHQSILDMKVAKSTAPLLSTKIQIIWRFFCIKAVYLALTNCQMQTPHKCTFPQEQNLS